MPLGRPDSAGSDPQDLPRPPAPAPPAVAPDARAHGATPRELATVEHAEGETGEPSNLAGFFREHAVDRSRLSRPLRWVMNAALVQIVAAALLVAEEAVGLPGGLWLPAVALVLGAGVYAALRALPDGKARRAGMLAARLTFASGAAVLLLTLLPLLMGAQPQHLITLDPGTTVPIVTVLAAALFLLVAESLVLAGASVARWPLRIPVVTLSVAVLGALAVPSLIQAGTSGATPQRAAVGTQLAVLLLLWLLGCWGAPLFARRWGARWRGESSRTQWLLPALWWGYLLLCLAVYYAAFMVGLAAAGGGAHTAAVVASLQTLLGLEAFWYLVLPLLFLAGTDFAEMGIVAAHSARQFLDRATTWRRGEGAASWAPAVMLGLTLVAALHGAVVVLGALGRQSSGRGADALLGALAAVVTAGGVYGVAALARARRWSVAETVPYWSLFVTSVAFAIYASLSVVSLVRLTAPILVAAALAVAIGVALVLLGPTTRGLVRTTGPSAGVFLVTWGVLVPLVLWTAHVVGAGEELGTADYLAVVVEVSVLQVLVGVAAAIGLPLLASATGWRRVRAAVRGPVLPIFVLQGGLQVLAWLAWLYHSAEGASDQLGWARALVLGAALLWDALLCGSQITNVAGGRFPRAARVPIYYGLLIGVATMVFYFASWHLGPDALQSGVNFQLYLSTERYPMIGLALFGVPMLVAGAVAALLMRERAAGDTVGEDAEAQAEQPHIVAERSTPAAPVGVLGNVAEAVGPPSTLTTPRADVASTSDGLEGGTTDVPVRPSGGAGAPLGMRGLVAGGLGLLAAAIVLGSVLGPLAVGRVAAAPIGSVRIGLDVGYDARGTPVVVDPRTTFASGDSFGFVAAVAPGRTFNTSALTMVVDARSANGIVTQVTAQALPALPLWTAHAYRLNPIDDLMGSCHGTQFTFVLRDNGAELGAANFTYSGCGRPASGLRGHLVFGAGAHAGADGVTYFVDRPASTFGPGDAFTVVVVASAPLTSQTMSVLVLQRAMDGTPQLIYLQQIAVPSPGRTTSFPLSITPIDGLMANCNPAASRTYVFDVGIGSSLLASGTFVYTGCGTARTTAGALALLSPGGAGGGAIVALAGGAELFVRVDAGVVVVAPGRGEAVAANHLKLVESGLLGRKDGGGIHTAFVAALARAPGTGTGTTQGLVGVDARMVV